jgi:low temperature requirement protein LtrA
VARLAERVALVSAVREACAVNSATGRARRAWDDPRVTTSPARSWYRRMTGRRTDEEHRTATPLELLFDLCFVVAVAQAAAMLHHELAAHHYTVAVLHYAAVFFAIWWAWMNFTWFASAYDTDDGPYRLATLVQITGALVLAAGVPRAFEHGDFAIATLGYVIMRIALVSQWLRAAYGDQLRRRTALRFAAGVALVQVGWVARLAMPDAWRWPAFVVLVLAELAVPIFAERATVTPYHRHHVAERYGLFTLIVLGESILAATVAIQTAFDRGQSTADLVVLAGSGLLIVFSMWWLYFDRTAGDLLTSGRMAFMWGYGHYVVFAAAAAVGAGLAASADGTLPTRAEGLVVAVPVALYVLAVWGLHICPHLRGPVVALFPVAGALVVGAAFTPAPLPVIAVVMTVLVAATTPLVHRGSSSRR